jgi:hypothetical protein
MATLAMDSTSDCHPADDKGIMFLIHHLFLPPQLPQEDDTKPSLDRLLLDTVQEALLQYGELDKSHKGAMAKIVRAVGSLRAVLGSDGELYEARLAKSLEGLSSCQYELLLAQCSVSYLDPANSRSASSMLGLPGLPFSNLLWLCC